jgi:hypothetical protein
MASAQLEVELSSLPLQKLYELLRPITVPIHHARFNNWGQSFYCTPLAIFEPESERQCRWVLELARREGKTVRAVGVGHSPSDLACTSGYMIRLTKLNRLIQVCCQPPFVYVPNVDAIGLEPSLDYGSSLLVYISCFRSHHHINCRMTSGVLISSLSLIIG